VTARRDFPVAIVSMPFMTADRPSIQLGLLKAIACDAGFPARTLHANLDFAARLGAGNYRRLVDHRGPLFGDWLFSLAAFADDAPDPHARLLYDVADELRYLGPPAEVHRWLARIRDRDVPAYLDALLDDVPWSPFRVVAFSSTFQQNTASFALARRLKERYPHIVTIFGGANFDGDMGLELVRSTDCVDLAVSGEADIAFPALLGALADGTDPGAVPGVVRRTGDGRAVVAPVPRPEHRLDDSPVPDYGEYFERAERMGLQSPAGRHDVWIPLETARGCWWGAKHHCVFCGLNATSMRFRAKSPQRVLDELATLARRYHSFRFAAVDNIVDVSYLRSLFPAIIDSAADYEFFFEAKANLTRAQIRLLARAGVMELQPGIESLSTHVLRLMRKGVTAAQNINLLRWARYYGIRPMWNVLWGIPGETKEDYAAQAAVVPTLVHLQPPESADRVWLERFSPFYTDPDAFPTRSLKPERSYSYVYPRDVDLDKVAYFFDHEFVDSLPDETYANLSRGIDDWQTAWRSDPLPVLTYRSSPNFLEIYDGRWPGREGTYGFDGTLADVYLACSERPTTATAVCDRLGGAVPVDNVRAICREFTRLGLMILDGPLALALAMPAVAGR
jgi:ribosomal peptide maturation radical SAM protein 1